MVRPRLASDCCSSLSDGCSLLLSAALTASSSCFQPDHRQPLLSPKLLESESFASILQCPFRCRAKPIMSIQVIAVADFVAVMTITIQRRLVVATVTDFIARPRWW